MPAAAAALLVAAAAAGAVAPPCDLTKAPDDFCADFCAYRCGFYNTSLGETGEAQNITVYRITPSNVTGPENRNTADAAGDVSFVLTQKNVTQMCLHNASQRGCHTDVEARDLYGAFVLEVDGQWGPYQMCNPADGWDTTAWKCGQQCMDPTHDGCPATPSWGPRRNASYEGHPTCWCARTARTAGRQGAPRQKRGGPCYPGMPCPFVPDAWPAQCAMGQFGAPTKEGTCYAGTLLRSVAGWSAEAAETTACKECVADPACGGWRVRGEGLTVDLLSGNVTLEPCDAARGASAARQRSRYGGGGSTWYGVGLGGMWYSHTVEGECAPGRPLGTDGCTWRLVRTVAYKNSTCVDTKADAAVERHGAACFSMCPHPLDRNTDCYLDCYRNTLLGDASLNITRPPASLVVDPWVRAMTDDPAHGGCPQVEPGLTAV